MIKYFKQLIFLLIVKIKDPSVKIEFNNLINKGDYLKANVVFGRSVLIFHHVSLIGKVKIGDYSSLNNLSEILASQQNEVQIGKFTAIARNVFIVSTNDHNSKTATNYSIRHVVGPGNFSDIGARVEIGNDVWIGAGSIILPGVKIGDGSVIGAGSVLTQNTVVGACEVWAGVPAVKIKDRFDSEEKKKRYLEMKWWDWDLEKLKQNKEIFEREF